MGFMKSIDQFYSWSNKDLVEGRLHTRIDHSIRNEKWWQDSSDNVVHYNIHLIYDHFLLVLKVTKEEGEGKKAF